MVMATSVRTLDTSKNYRKSGKKTCKLQSKLVVSPLITPIILPYVMIPYTVAHVALENRASQKDHPAFSGTRASGTELCMTGLFLALATHFG